MDENVKKAALSAVLALEDKKGEDITILDISEISTLADLFVICSGNNRSQVQALCDNVDEALGKIGMKGQKTEGYDTANWVLMDYRDIVIHIFDKENRLFYDLERIWRDGKQLGKEDLA
ncbi:MAG: ribosome silencing factor [Lachnospiraceae bacterium]|nr:ribosome silencing factor [Lachnospiraceae bacterium]